MEIGLHIRRDLAGYQLNEAHRRMIVLGGWDGKYRDASSGF